MPINRHHFIIFVTMMCMTITTRAMEQEEKEYLFKEDGVICEEGDSYKTYVTTLLTKESFVAKKRLDPKTNKPTITYYISNKYNKLVRLPNKDNDPKMFIALQNAYNAHHQPQK